MLTVANVVDFLEQFAPPQLAADWDNVGLLLGSRASPVERVMTCLTVTPESAEEAIASKANLIVTHHPILFKPTQQLTDTTAEGRILLSLLQNRVSVYSPHTAFDNTAGGINDILARRLGLASVVPLRRGEGAKQCKLVMFVPDADLGPVSDAVFAAGAGVIGQYRECGFRLAGTGTFFGTDATNPTVGQKGRREEVSEWRLEMVCPEERIGEAIRAMRKAHSYEEPAFDVYPLRAMPGSRGEGRVGQLPEAQTLRAFAEQVKQALNARTVQVVGDPELPARRIALACGAAGSFLNDAIRAGADVFLTGEMRFHDYLAARARGIALVLPGHYATERCGVEELAHTIHQALPELQVWASHAERDPSDWV